MNIRIPALAASLSLALSAGPALAAWHSQTLTRNDGTVFYGAFVDTDDGVGLAVSCSGYGEKHLALLFTPATADFDKSPDADTDMTFDIDGKSLTIFTAFVAAADGRLAATHVPGAHTELAEVYDALSGAKKAIKVSLYNYETDDLVEATFSADGVQEALKTLFDNCPY